MSEALESSRIRTSRAHVRSLPARKRSTLVGRRLPALRMALGAAACLSLGACGVGGDEAGGDDGGGPAAVARDDRVLAPSFAAVQADLFSASGAQANAWADFDGDNDLDMFVGFRGRPNRLYRNDQGTFADVAAEMGLADETETRAAAWGDFDGDLDPDLFVGFADAGAPVRLYRNESGRGFVDVAAEVGVVAAGVTRQPAFVDYDGDGDLDLFVAFRDRANALFRNDGDTFTDVTEASGIGDPRRTVGVAWFDMDGDSDLDVFVANQNGDEDGFYRNAGDGTFTDVAAELGMSQPDRAEEQGSVGTAVADYDNDGDIDLFVASYGPDVLWENQGDGTFVDVAPGTPLAGDHHSVAAAWGDYDNDGWVDLYVNTFLADDPEAPDHLFRNDAGAFEDVTPDAMLEHGSSHGVAWVDWDVDGDLDLSLANNDPEMGTHPLYANRTDAARAVRSIQVAVVDNEGRWTRPGAQVQVARASDGWTSSRIIDTGGGYASQSMIPAHFGLPPGAGPLAITVSWFEQGQRRTSTVSGVDPARFARQWVIFRLGVQ